jgi:hypothetical protein
MINTLAGYRPLLLTIIVSLLACSQDRGEEKTSSTAAMPTLSPEKAHSAYDFVNSIGVNCHLNYFDRTYGNFQLVQHELASIGIRHIRDGVHLQSADYNKVIYGRWSQLGDIGIRFDAVVDPRSALGPITPDKLTEVEELANHTIESFEGPNELDISQLPDWASIDRDYQETIFRSVAAMPKVKSIAVIGPSMARASNGSSVGDISDHLNYGNLHPYPAGKIPSAVFPEQPLLAKEISNDRKIIITESGYHNALNDHSDQPGISESASAKYIPRLFLENFSYGISRTYLYELLDEAPDPGLTNFQMHWGLIRSDGSEKPAFTAMKNLMNELNDVSEPAALQQLTYSLSTENVHLHHMLLQHSNGDFFLILWQEVPSYDLGKAKDIDVSSMPITLRMDHNVKTVNVYEPVVQARPLSTYAYVTTVSLDVPDHPLVVRITP